jgi:hypothetical protein
MKARGFLCVVAFALLVRAAFAGFASAKGTTLDAVRVEEAPSLDGIASDAAWAAAPSLEVAIPQVTLKAVYDDQYLYVLAQVYDSTASFTRAGA